MTFGNKINGNKHFQMFKKIKLSIVSKKTFSLVFKILEVDLNTVIYEKRKFCKKKIILLIKYWFLYLIIKSNFTHTYILYNNIVNVYFFLNMNLFFNIQFNIVYNLFMLLLDNFINLKKKTLKM